MSKFLFRAALVLPLLLLTGCTTNPVTGESELTFMSEAQELRIGEEYYLPTQQSQGGELTIDEDLTDYVSEVGQRLAAVSDRDLPYEFVVLNNSVPNAWALPGGKIAINRGLLTALENEAELAAVLGHEVVHAAARHSAQAQTRGMLLQGALIASMVGAQSSEYSNVIMAGASLGAQLITSRYGREAERESDQYGIEYMVRAGYDPSGAVTLQEKFVELSKSKGRNPSWFEGLFASHPPSQERVENNIEQVAALDLAGRDLRVGEARYRQELAFMHDSAPAYEVLTTAYEAAKDDDLEKAMDLLDRGAAMLPQEAKFDGLRGDILLDQRRYRAAIDSYSRAIEKNNAYFTYHLGRGVAHARLDNADQARVDLERSAELLPTATAAMELGNLALANRDLDQAKQYFRAAAQSGGEVGERAAVAYARLDMPENPANYFRVQAGTDDRGRLLAQVSNAAGIAVTDVQVEFQVIIAGRTQSGVRSVGAMEAGATRVIDSGVTLPPEVAADPRLYRAQVVSARPR